MEFSRRSSMESSRCPRYCLTCAGASDTGSEDRQPATPTASSATASPRDSQHHCLPRNPLRVIATALLGRVVPASIVSALVRWRTRGYVPSDEGGHMPVSRVESVQRCDDFIGVRIEKPAGYTFTAGQWFRVSLPALPDAGTRTFSIACAPADGWLEIGTRYSESAFKQALAGMPAGGPVEISAPAGSLRLPEPASSSVLLAGGIGITPVRSLVREAISRGADVRGAVLVYANRDEKCVPYRQELEGWRDHGVSVVEVFERPIGAWRGERGFISADILQRCGVTADRTFVVTGPPAMVAAMRTVLDELGVPADRRRVESFSGYADRGERFGGGPAR